MWGVLSSTQSSGSRLTEAWRPSMSPSESVFNWHMRPANNLPLLPLFQENLWNTVFGGVVALYQQHTREMNRNLRWTQPPLLLHDPQDCPLSFNGTPYFPRLYDKSMIFPFSWISFTPAKLPLCNAYPSFSACLKTVFMQFFQIS